MNFGGFRGLPDHRSCNLRATRLYCGSRAIYETESPPLIGSGLQLGYQICRPDRASYLHKSQMTQVIPYEVLDVFTSEPFSGNPLAIVELTLDLSPARKLQIAREFNFSETVFWHKYIQEKTSKIDIWTPAGEIPFAGHPTIGAATTILARSGATEGQIQIKAGTLTVYLDENGFTYAEIPHNAHQHHYKPQENAVMWSIVKGMTFVLVKLESLEDLRLQNKEIKVSEDSQDPGWQGGLIGTYYYVQNADDPTSVNCRMFCSFDSSGIEDAATGSAACTLMACLSYESQASSLSISLVQGAEMGRRSVIKVKAEREGTELKKMTLGGQAVRIMQGQLTLRD